MDKPALTALRERVEKLTGPIDGVAAGALANDLSPWQTDSDEWVLFVNALRPGVNAIGSAIALVEQIRPGIWWVLAKGKTRSAEPLFGANLMFGADEIIGGGESDATPAIALIIALLRSLEAGER